MTTAELNQLPELKDARRIALFTGHADEVVYDENDHGWLVGTFDGERVRRKFMPVSSAESQIRR